MQVEGPVAGVSQDCERVLRSLPAWFGDESSLLEYVNDCERYPTFVARGPESINAFVTVREHFPESWEIHCIAVQAVSRNQGLGRALLSHAEAWLAHRGVRFLQVKTLAASHPSAEYAETRNFYVRSGYLPLEVFPILWAKHLPVLQLAKFIQNAA